MRHDPFCYYSDPKNEGLWEGDDPCEDCRRMELARADEREQAAQRVSRYLDTVSDPVYSEIEAAVFGSSRL